MTVIFDSSPQGSEEWLQARVGAITGSRIRDAREKIKSGGPGSKSIGYAMDKARERAGGIVPPLFQNAAMRTGTEQEPIARLRYEAETGDLVQEVGFASTEDGRFGASVDGLIGEHGVWECKTMVSSATLFRAVVDGDISDYRDQCVFALWLLGRRWVDLSLWCPDLDLLHTIRIDRDEEEIAALESDLVAFDRLVDRLAAELLRAKLAPQAANPPWLPDQATAAPTPSTNAPAVLAPTF